MVCIESLYKTIAFPQSDTVEIHLIPIKLSFESLTGGSLRQDCPAVSPDLFTLFIQLVNCDWKPHAEIKLP
jgi:hypothetical protein